MKAAVLVVAVVAAWTISAAQPEAHGDAQDDILRSWLAAGAQHRPGNAASDDHHVIIAHHCHRGAWLRFGKPHRLVVET